MSKPKFLNLNDLPEDNPEPGEQRHPIHQSIDSDEWYDIHITMMFEEIRNANPDAQADQTCRSILSRIKGLQDMIDLGSMLKENNIISDETPSENREPQPDDYLE